MKIHALTSAVVVLAAAGAAAYSQNLVPLDTTAGVARGINDNGDVVFARHIYIYPSGPLQSLGTGILVDDSGPTGPSNFEGAAINNNREIAGAIWYHAGFRDSAGNASDLGVLPGVLRSSSSAAYGLNNAGYTVGSGQNLGLFYGWYAPPGGPLIPLTPPGNSSSAQIRSTAYAINDAGLVTGFFGRYNSIPGGHERIAYRFNTNTLQWTELGYGVGNAINASGVVAGTLDVRQDGGCGNPFLYDGSVLKRLDRLNDVGGCGEALAISNSGMVGGWSNAIDGLGDQHPFIYHGAMQDLNDLVLLSDPLKATAQLHDVVGITTNGLVVVNGLDKTDPSNPIPRAWLLKIPPVLFDGGTQNFGDVAAGTTSAPKIVTMINKGSSTVTINSIAMRGAFAQTNNCPASLASGASCTFNVTFSPPAAGSYTGGLTVTVNGKGLRTFASGQTPMGTTLAISSTNVIAQVPFTLTWAIPAGSSCYGTNNSYDLVGGEQWSSTKDTSGSRSYTAPYAGDYTIGIHCTLNGAVGTATVQFTATWPTVTASLTPSATTVYAGTNFTLSWASAFANECYPTSVDDPGWAAAWRPASGSLVMPAPSSLSVPVQYTYSIRCESFGSHQSATALTVVTMDPGPPPVVVVPPPVVTPPAQPPPPSNSSNSSGGGGGSLDGSLLALLAGSLLISGTQRRRWANARRPD